MELRINYSIPITFTVVVERDELPDEHELLESITKDELLTGDGELTWDDIKWAWRNADPNDVIVTDKNYEELYL